MCRTHGCADPRSVSLLYAQKAGNAFRALGRMASLQKMLSGGSLSQSSSSSLSSIPDTPTPAAAAAQSGSGLSTPVPQFSLFADPLSSPPPAAGKVVEDKEKPAASTTSAATTTVPTTSVTTRPAATTADVGSSPRPEGGNRLAADTDIDGCNSVTGRTTAATATSRTAAAGGQTASPSSRRRAWEDAQSDRRVGAFAHSGADPGAANVTARVTAAHAKAADVAEDVKDEGVRRKSPSSHLPRVNTYNTTTDSNGFSPSRAPRLTNGGGGDNDDNHDSNSNDKKSESCPPAFVKEMVDCTVFTGDVVRFDVQVTGQPAPQLVWTLEEEVVEEDERHILELGENGLCSLIVRHVTEDDEGEYSCRAVNSLGEVTCSAELSIYGMGAV